MNLDHITINTQSSVKIAGSSVLYFDPFKVETDFHDEDFKAFMDEYGISKIPKTEY